MLFSLASAACALAPSSGLLIAFRAVQGLGAAIVMPLGLTLLTSSFPADRRGAVVGIWGGVAGLGVASGPLVGGAVTEGLDWHWVFWVNVPLGLAAALAVRRVLPETYGPRTRLDPLGMVTASGAMAALVFGVLRSPELGWGSAEVLGSLALGVVLLAAFVAWQAVAPAPMVPLSLFRSRVFSAACADAVPDGGVDLRDGVRHQPVLPGLAGRLAARHGTAVPAVDDDAAAGRTVAGKLVDRVGARALAVPGLMMQAVGFLWLLHEAHTHASYAAFVAPFVLAGVGISMALPAPSAAGLNAAPPELLGRAAGVVNTVQQIGQAAGVAVVTVVFDAHGSLASPASTLAGYEPALVTAAGISVLGALAALGIRRQRSSRSMTDAGCGVRSRRSPRPSDPPGRPPETAGVPEADDPPIPAPVR